LYMLTTVSVAGPKRLPHPPRGSLGEGTVYVAVGGVGVQVGQLDEVRLVRFSLDGVVNEEC